MKKEFLLKFGDELVDDKGFKEIEATKGITIENCGNSHRHIGRTCWIAREDTTGDTIHFYTTTKPAYKDIVEVMSAMEISDMSSKNEVFLAMLTEVIK